MVFNNEQAELLKAYRQEHQSLTPKEQKGLESFLAVQFIGMMNENDQDGQVNDKKTLLPVSTLNSTQHYDHSPISS
jgi:hypothetical protein